MYWDLMLVGCRAVFDFANRSRWQLQLMAALSAGSAGTDDLAYVVHEYIYTLMPFSIMQSQHGPCNFVFVFVYFTSRKIALNKLNK